MGAVAIGKLLESANYMGIGVIILPLITYIC